MEFRERFPQAWAVFEHGRSAGWHSRLQIWVSQRSLVLADAEISNTGTRVGDRTIYPWLSSGKPLTAVAIGQLVERKLLSYHDPVARLIPEFAQNGKEGITLSHLLTHTGGFRGADKLEADLDWDDRIAQICATSIEPGWVPGKRAGYHTTSSWYLLGEIVRRFDGRPLQDYLRAEVLLPLGMADSWVGMPREQLENYRRSERFGTMLIAEGGELTPHAILNADPEIAACRPAGNARGPIAELARFYRFLLGELAPSRHILSRPAVETMLAPHRTGMFDETFLHKIDFGLGFILNSNRHGVETVPYGYGRYASDDAFGHGGSQSSCAFADPRHDLVVAWVFNAMCGERKHQKRDRDFNSALYEDLGVAR